MSLNDFEYDCSRKFVNGYISCARSHFSVDGQYTWEYKNGKLIIAGIFPTTVKKISNDEIQITYTDWTCTLKRVKGYGEYTDYDDNGTI